MTAVYRSKTIFSPRRVGGIFPYPGLAAQYERAAAQRPHCRPHRHGATSARGHGLCGAGGHAPTNYLLCRLPAALLLYAIFGTSRQLVVVVSSVQAVMSY